MKRKRSRSRKGVPKGSPDYQFQRAADKLKESGFFLDLMGDHKTQPEQFGYYSSAFLNAMKTVSYMLQMSGKPLDLGRNPELSILLECRDIEVHGKGILVYPSREVERFRPSFLTDNVNESETAWCCPDARTTNFYKFCVTCWSNLGKLGSQTMETDLGGADAAESLGNLALRRQKKGAYGQRKAVK